MELKSVNIPIINLWNVWKISKSCVTFITKK